MKQKQLDEIKARAEAAIEAGKLMMCSPRMVLDLVEETERLKAKVNQLIDALDGTDHLSYYPELAGKEE